jgi:hypothetical protein
MQLIHFSKKMKFQRIIILLCVCMEEIGIMHFFSYTCFHVASARHAQACMAGFRSSAKCVAVCVHGVYTCPGRCGATPY